MQTECELATDTISTVPYDFQLVISALCVISSGGGIVAAGYMNWRDISWGVGGVSVWVLIEGVVSRCGTVWRNMSDLHLDRARRKDHGVADDRLGVRATGSRAASLVGQVTLYHEDQQWVTTNASIIHIFLITIEIHKIFGIASLLSHSWVTNVYRKFNFSK